VARIGDSTSRGFIGSLLADEGRLLPRLRGVIELDPAVYAEIDADAGAIPQAFIVILVAAILAAASFSPYALFSSIAGMLFAWLVAAALVWAVGTLVTRQDVDYARLLRCLGFAYAWIAPLCFSGLPFYIGEIVTVLAMVPLFGSFWLATRQVVGVDSTQALVICGTALILPLLLVWVAS
jgi:hypothetical protein